MKNFSDYFLHLTKITFILKMLYNVIMKSIYDIPLNSAEGTPNHLEQYKGKVTLVVNTTVGCGNANQLEVLQWLQEKYQDQGFEIIAIPTNDYCGPGITSGPWSEGITCGLDSKAYGEDIYGTTFKYSEMVASLPHDKFYEMFPKVPSRMSGVVQENKPPHELYVEITSQVKDLRIMAESSENLNAKEKFISPWLNIGFYTGFVMGGNFEKYLIDRDGYVIKHFANTVLNYDIEKTLKERMIAEGQVNLDQHKDRTPEMFPEEYALVCSEIEKAIAGARSPLNPLLTTV
jgi:glutathione peroxidase-family protein